MIDQPAFRRAARHRHRPVRQPLPTEPPAKASASSGLIVAAQGVVSGVADDTGSAKYHLTPLDAIGRSVYAS
jgi:hypothetical protein